MKKFIILLFLSITSTLFPMQSDDLHLANPERYQQHFQLMQKEAIDSLIAVYEEQIEFADDLSEHLKPSDSFQLCINDPDSSLTLDQLRRMYQLVAKESASEKKFATLNKLEELFGSGHARRVPRQRKSQQQENRENVGVSSSQPKKSTWGTVKGMVKGLFLKEKKLSLFTIYNSYNRSQITFLNELHTKTGKRRVDLMQIQIKSPVNGRYVPLWQVIRNIPQIDSTRANWLTKECLQTIKNQEQQKKKSCKGKDKVKVHIPSYEELVDKVKRLTGFSKSYLRNREEVLQLADWMQKNPDKIDELHERFLATCRLLLREKLIQSLIVKSGFNEREILGSRHSNKQIADWLEELRIDPQVWQRFSNDVCKELLIERNCKELNALGIPRRGLISRVGRRDQRQLTSVTLEGLKKAAIEDEVKQSPDIIQQISFQANDSQRLQQDKQYLFQIAQQRLSGKIGQEDHKINQATNKFGLTGIGFGLTAGTICSYVGLSVLLRTNKLPNDFLDALGFGIISTSIPYLYPAITLGIKKYFVYKEATRKKTHFEALYQHAQSELLKHRSQNQGQEPVAVRVQPARALQSPQENKKQEEIEEQDEERECPICMDYMTDNTITTKCKHEFHVVCLQAWNGPCPLCRCEDYLN